MIGQSIKLEKPLVNFVDYQYLLSYFLGKSVVIVGSGPGVLDNQETFIDSHDIVVRVNNYKTDQYSKKTGVRTDVHYSFYGSSIRKTSSELIKDGVSLCMCKCPDSKFIESEWHRRNNKELGVDYRYIYKNRKDFWFCDTYIPRTEDYLKYFKLLDNHIPTTGFSCILDFLGFPFKSLHITGFDFFTSKIHNVDEEWADQNKRDPIKHMPNKEFALFKLEIEKRRVTVDKRLRRLMSGDIPEKPEVKAEPGYFN